MTRYDIEDSWRSANAVLLVIGLMIMAVLPVLFAARPPQPSDPRPTQWDGGTWCDCLGGRAPSIPVRKDH